MEVFRLMGVKDVRLVQKIMDRMAENKANRGGGEAQREYIMRCCFGTGARIGKASFSTDGGLSSGIDFEPIGCF
ncbi:MAG: hypothetical protein JST83_00310 [Bacteroidetes bacterium]|nr:hypothetical protein [Bacteroidota bacterium]